MKEKIHPNYKESTIICACGETIHTRSTKPSIRVEICSKCHPFFTGKQKLVDSAGRVEKFMKKYGMAEEAGAKSEQSKTEEKVASKSETSVEETPVEEVAAEEAVEKS